MADPLPIYDIETEILARLQQHRRLIISAPTGSGKSTQVPQMLLRHGLLGPSRFSSPGAAGSRSGQVVILQPRRLAARLLAARVAEELGAPLGAEVGYQIRFENVTSAATKIRYVTEGVLLRQMIDDPTLGGVSALIFDEFHERHLYGDITLARALDLQETERPDLLIVVMSATLDLDLVTRYLGEVRTHQEPGAGSPSGISCSVLSSPGRVYPVEVRHSREPSYLDKRPVWEQAAEAFANYVRAGGTGDALVFMPGSFEIAQTIEAVRNLPESKGCLLLPLHGELPPRDQDAAVARYDQPKVVVSTNVAETSLTIDGVRLVVDSGLARIPRYDPYRGLNTLLVEKISRASAEQRAGRAGRTAPGVCLRLWSEREHADRLPQELPEVKRLDLAEVVLTLKAAGVADLRKFRWLEAPDEQALAHAEELLIDLGALRVGQASCLSLSGPQQEGAPTGRNSPAHPVAISRSTAESARPANSTERVAEVGNAGVKAERQGAGVKGADRQDACPPRDDRQDACPTRGDRQDACPTSITALGRRMLAFPVHPRYARMLLAAQDYGCVYQACLVAALTQGRDLLLRKIDKQVAEFRDDLLGEKASSDFWILMRAWNYSARNNYRLEACRKLGIHAVTARQVGPLFDQFLRLAKAEGLNTEPREVGDEALQKCILIGFSDRVARRVDSGTLRAELVHGRRGVLARESAVQQSPLFVVAEVREVGRQGGETNTILSLATAIEPKWLAELFPADVIRQPHVFFDAATRRVAAEEQLRFRDLPLEKRRIDPPADAAARLLAEEVIAGRLTLQQWDHSVEQWILRLNLLSHWCPELELPPIREEARHHLVEQLCQGALGYKDIKDKPVKPLVQSWLSSSQRALLDEQAPERLELSNGRKPKITYENNASPWIALRIQELYDVRATPKLAFGRVPVSVHILAPNMRPVQITQDLGSFWREHYPSIKQELQRKYPKHEWR